jgi:asparagine synthase (glutamine-hydrolysing)
MCGICGFSGPPLRSVLFAMMNAVVHRGPDEGGHLEAPGMSLGMRRLSIVDVESGSQPVYNEDRSVAVVFNGEIYNHRALRAELEAAGHRFQSHHSDTEVLVHLYEEFGDQFLDRLVGMFAIAVWDYKRRRLLLARDRVGIKPLYFAFLEGKLIFASEIKSLLAHPMVQRRPNFRALYHYFSFKNIPAPWSAFAAIEQLRPGEKLILEDGALRREAWWKLRFDEDTAVGEQDAAQAIRKLLEDSVRECMQADVPYGAYLSGGLDSSSVVALMSNLSGRRIQTFSLVYADEIQHKQADQDFARRVARQFDTDHHECVLTHRDVAECMDAVVAAFDEPFSGVTSTYFVTRLISQHAKVALSGDGADELFGSYLAHRLAQPLDNLHRLAKKPESLTAEELSTLEPYSGQLNYLVDMLARGDEVQRRASLSLWNDAEKKRLLSDEMLSLCAGESSEQRIYAAYAAAETADPLNRALYCDLQLLLPDQVLAFVDRLSMAHSVEVRPPFLDHRLVEFAARLPGSMKIHHGRSKHILKEAVRGLLPDDLINRPKEGFVLPLDLWLSKEMRPFVEDTLAPPRLKLHGLLREDSVLQLLRDHFSRTANNGPRIWNLVMFQSWWERYIAA